MPKRTKLLLAGLLAINLTVLIVGGVLTDNRSCQRQVNPREVQRDFLNSDATFQQALADLDGPAELTSDRQANRRQIRSVNRSLHNLGVKTTVAPGITIDDAAAALRSAVADRWRRDAASIQIPNCAFPADG